MSAKKIFVKTKNKVNDDDQNDSNITASLQVISEDTNDDEDDDKNKRDIQNLNSIRITYQEIYQYLLSLLGSDKAVSAVIKLGKAMWAEGVKAVNTGRMFATKDKKKQVVQGFSDSVNKSSDRSR